MTSLRSTLATPARDQLPGVIRARVSEDEYDACKEAARKAGLHIREWALVTLLLAAGYVDDREPEGKRGPVVVRR